MEERLAKEIMDAANNTGASVKTRRHTQKWQTQTAHLLIIVGKILSVCRVRWQQKVNLQSI